LWKSMWRVDCHAVIVYQG